MNDERERLEDLNIEEAVGRTTPPDLTDRILAAADKRELDEAVTPISGRHAVPRTHRPTGRRMTGAVAKKNWQGAGIVTVFALLFTVGLVTFVLLKDTTPTKPEQDTAETPQANEPPKSDKKPNQSPPRKRWSPDSNKEQPEAPDPTDEPEPNNEPEPKKPDDVIDQPEPEPKDPFEQPKPEPKDTVEQPKPEPEEPKDTVDEPQPEPDKPKDAVEGPKEDVTEAKPTPELIAVGYVPVGAYHRGVGHYKYRTSVDGELHDFYPHEEAPKSDPADTRKWLYEGWQLKSGSGDVYLTNGALVRIDGEIGFHTHAEGLRIELIDDELYVDNVASSSTVFVTHEDLEVEISEGASVFDLSTGKLGIFCVDGQVSAGGEVILAGHVATLGKRGLSAIREASRRDWSHPLLTGATPRQLGLEEFDLEPLGGMISGMLESRSKEQLESQRDGHVAVDAGSKASVAFQFDGEHRTLRGEKVRIRYRATGASKLILQMFCPARNDNFGTDLSPGKEGEWHILEVSLADLRDRETHNDAPPPGTVLSSISLILTGKDDAQLEVDWVELVREAKFEK